MYRDGRGVASGGAETLRCFRQAAEQGDGSSQVNLGWLYAHGHGVAQDHKEAVK